MYTRRLSLVGTGVARLREIRGLAGAVTRSTLNSGALVVSHSSSPAFGQSPCTDKQLRVQLHGLFCFKESGNDARCELADTHSRRDTHTHAKRAVERGERLKMRRWSRRQREPRAISQGSSVEQSASNYLIPPAHGTSRQAGEKATCGREREAHRCALAGAERDRKSPPPTIFCFSPHRRAITTISGSVERCSRPRRTAITISRSRPTGLT